MNEETDGFYNLFLQHMGKIFIFEIINTAFKNQFFCWKIANSKHPAPPMPYNIKATTERIYSKMHTAKKTGAISKP